MPPRIRARSIGTRKTVVALPATRTSGSTALALVQMVTDDVVTNATTLATPWIAYVLAVHGVRARKGNTTVVGLATLQ